MAQSSYGRCYGTGQSTCLACGGQTRCYMGKSPLHPDGYSGCGICGATGTTPCGSCGGTGRRKPGAGSSAGKFGTAGFQAYGGVG